LLAVSERTNLIFELQVLAYAGRARLSSSFAFVLSLAIITLLLASCSADSNDNPPTVVPDSAIVTPTIEATLTANATSTTEVAAVPVPTGTSTVDSTDATAIVGPTATTAPREGSSPGPAPSPTPPPLAPLFSGYDLEFSTGDFWRFRWEWTDTSCAQGSGCRTTDDDGIFQITLGESKEWLGTTVYRVIVVGNAGYHDDPTTRSFVPEWAYLGVVGQRIVATNATGSSPLITLFDGQVDRWAGSGFFRGRFPDDALVSASPGELTGTHEFASWDGVETGPWHFVQADDSGGECSTFDGRILCPTEEKFDYTETEYYRPGIGPFAYMYNYAASFSGGGFTSSFSTGERVALIASSFAGDEAGDFGKPTPIPPTVTVTPSPAPVVLGDPIFGPRSGFLNLEPQAIDIPEFESGVVIDAGVADALFVNPNVSGKWSHGILFRGSAEERFHAVFINSDGEWGHFARGGSLASSETFALGNFDFDRSIGGENRLTVWFGVLDGANKGLLRINDQDVAILDLSFADASAAGDVSVVSGLFPADDFDGSATQFIDFTVYAKP
jgi:hypothetical protein